MNDRHGMKRDLQVLFDWDLPLAEVKHRSSEGRHVVEGIGQMPDDEKRQHRLKGGESLVQKLVRDDIFRVLEEERRDFISLLQIRRVRKSWETKELAQVCERKPLSETCGEISGVMRIMLGERLLERLRDDSQQKSFLTALERGAEEVSLDSDLPVTPERYVAGLLEEMEEDRNQQENVAN